MRNLGDWLLKYWSVLGAVATVIFLTGGAWSELHSLKATVAEVKPKVEEIATMKVEITNIKGDISSLDNNVFEIRSLMVEYLNAQKNGRNNTKR